MAWLTAVASAVGVDPGVDVWASGGQPAAVYVIDRAKKTDIAVQWALPDRIFFACGACQVLAYVVVQTYGDAGFRPYWIRPAPGYRGNHIVASDGVVAFDYHGWSSLDRLLEHTRAKANRWWPGWTYDLVDIAPEVLVSEEKSRAIGCHMREPGQFLHNALPRASAFLASKEPGGGPFFQFSR